MPPLGHRIVRGALKLPTSALTPHRASIAGMSNPILPPAYFASVNFDIDKGPPGAYILGRGLC